MSNCEILLLYLSVCFCLISIAFSSGPSNHIFTYCPSNETLNYPSNSTFGLNIKTILNDLPKNTSVSGFYDGSVGSNPDTVYALALCRGDVSPSDCEQCVRNASLDILQQCKTIDATIWFEFCQVRYSYLTFFSSMTFAGKYELDNEPVNPVISGSDFSRFMKELSYQAARNLSRKMFAVGLIKVSDHTVYGLAQCTRDLSSDDCRNCLTQAFGDLNGCCATHKRGMILNYYCNMRFETTPFYNSTTVNEIVVSTERSSRTWVLIVAIGVPILVIAIIAASFAIYFWQRKKIEEGNAEVLKSALTIPEHVVMTKEGDLVSTEGLPFMDLDILKDATDNFSSTNLLGQGGFGAVYKGRLPDGTEVAVKRLVKGTWQGADEFRNEIILIANLQHRNLVRLLGCGLKGQEKILVYEYLSKKSLDLYIYDAKNRADLTWNSRLNIIKGISRGLFYLHEGSRLRIIHRDLKPSNVLLDQDMTAKISDFGIARIFCQDQNTATTKRVVGTYGYMAPEYAMEGLFSVKSDVFSFGVIALEIISGIRSSQYIKEHSKSLVAYAWKLWNEGKELEFVDSLLAVPYPTEEVLRCLHIALLCVQEDPTERPTMATVISLLNGESLTLPQPKSPAVSLEHEADNIITSSSSVNELTTSTLGPR